LIYLDLTAISAQSDYIGPLKIHYAVKAGEKLKEQSFGGI